jgi:hypothetical protein
MALKVHIPIATVPKEVPGLDTELLWSNPHVWIHGSSPHTTYYPLERSNGAHQGGTIRITSRVDPCTMERTLASA